MRRLREGEGGRDRAGPGGGESALRILARPALPRSSDMNSLPPAAGPAAKARAQSPAANLPLMFAKVTPSIL